MNRPLYDLTREFQNLKTIAELGYDPLTGEAFDAADIDKMWGRLEAEGEDKIIGTAYVLKRLMAEASMVDAELKRLKYVKQRRQAGIENLKEKLRLFMETSELTKVKSPTLSVSLGAIPKRVVVTIDPEKLPKPFRRVTIEPNKVLLKKHLQDDKTITGVSLEDGVSPIIIR